MFIKIYYYEVFGKGTMMLHLTDHATIRDALHELNRKFGDTFQRKTGRTLEEALKSPFNVFLNEEYIDLQSDIERALTEGDQIVILRPVSGGGS